MYNTLLAFGFGLLFRSRQEGLWVDEREKKVLERKERTYIP